MPKLQLIILFLLAFAISAHSQETPRDTIPVDDQQSIPVDSSLAIDTSFDLDELLDEMDDFLDSLLRPRSNFLVSVSAGSNFFNYWKKNPLRLESVRKRIYSPVVGYYHKSGPGITLTGNVTHDGQQWNLYQFALSPSFDFIQNSNWIGGISYTHYFTRDSLPFYTSPLQNEFNGYFIWRKSWVQPGLSLGYGYGSRTDLERRERFIRYLRLRRGIIINTRSTETVADFSLTASLRHSFYWLNILGKKDHIKLTPQIAFASGTQKFGFNRNTSVYSINLRNATNLLYNTGDVDVDQDLKFQPLSLSLYIRPEYMIGKFFIQPQYIFDYYFPSENVTHVFSLNAGLLF